MSPPTITKPAEASPTEANPPQSKPTEAKPTEDTRTVAQMMQKLNLTPLVSPTDKLHEASTLVQYFKARSTRLDQEQKKIKKAANKLCTENFNRKKEINKEKEEEEIKLEEARVRNHELKHALICDELAVGREGVRGIEAGLGGVGDEEVGLDGGEVDGGEGVEDGQGEFGGGDGNGLGSEDAYDAEDKLGSKHFESE